MSNADAQKNKAIVLKAFDTLFNKRDYAEAEQFWSPNYIQHSAQIESGRDGLFNLIKAAPASLKHEPGVILAEGDYVIVHGRFLPERNKQFTKRCSDKSLYPGRYRCNLTRQPYRNCLYKRFTGLTELAGSNFRRCCKVGFSVTSPCERIRLEQVT
jgi:predicted SnoaL-like aldol condensation-catalyzing enzyme